jgi:DNA-binding CsgD family transcriptional regulator
MNESLQRDLASDAFGLTKSLLKTLVSSANPDDFCRSLVHSVLAGHGAMAAFVCRVDPDGRLQMMGSYGYEPDRVSKENRPSIWEPMGITESIRTGQIMVFNGWEDYLIRYPKKANLAGPGKAFVAVPFAMAGSPAGGLGVAFNRYVTQDEFNQMLWETISLIGEVYVSPAWFNAVNSTLKFGNAEANQNTVPSLTTRQHQILAYIRQGLTNDQIARNMSFSQSTIKQETMKIFRALGVTNREEAAEAALRLGS